MRNKDLRRVHRKISRKSLVICERKRPARKRALNHVEVFECVNEVTRRLLKLLDL